MHEDQEEHTVLRRVLDLLDKTIENGALPEEEKASVQLAYVLTRLHDLDFAVLKYALSRVGTPPRYVVTGDGFLVPATALKSPPWDGTDRRRRTWDGNERRRSRDGTAGVAGPECPASPSGKHRMVPILQGTFRTGFEGCAHCGTRRRL